MRTLYAAAACWLVLSLLYPSAPRASAEPLDFDVLHGHFFKQANGQGGAGDTGFAVVDDDAPFWTEFRRLGGVATLGYPVSRRFEWDGFLVQAFQKAVFQWRPEVRQVYFVNVFDRLAAAGKDPWLEVYRQTPPSFDHSADADLGWDGVVKRHLAFLEVNPAIRTKYLADSDPILHFGLPMSYRDYGNVFVVRAQRAVFQQWKVDVPWAKAGEVVVANGGDVAKEAGLYPTVAVVPHTPEETQVWAFVAGPGAPGRLYVLRSQRVTGQPPGGETRTRLLVSDDAGQTWQSFAGGLPVEESCLWNVDMDYATPDALYASTCRGLYRWTGSRWESVSARQVRQVAVRYGSPRDIWAVESGRVVHSTDGGRTWANMALAALAIALDPRDARTVYGLSAFKGWWYSLWRGTGVSGQWTEVPLPYRSVAVHGMTVDGATGAIYVIAEDHTSGVRQLWRTSNPTAVDASTVRWELIQELGRGADARLLGSGRGPGGLVLYAGLGYLPGIRLAGSWWGDAGDDPVLARSLDGGRSWEPLPVR